VKAALVTNYGIATARLASKGFGSATPIAPNTTPEGRQNNRRVELVKI
jgi:outer membrane protein OmpA-like peptidoglycan-associated protein